MPIPLFRLPREPLDSLEIVLSFMDILELIGLSLLSRATKALIATPGIGINKFILKLHKCFMISLETQEGFLTWDLSPKYENWDGGDPVALTMANVVEVTHLNLRMAEQVYQWENIEDFGIRNWIEHFQDLTHTRKIHEISITGSFQKFEENSVLTTIRGLDINVLYFYLSTAWNEEYRQLILQNVQTRNLKFSCNPFREPGGFHEQILLQNYNCIETRRSSRIDITLNDLLTMNCVQLCTHPTDGLSMEDLNTFFKAWITGFNRRLKGLTIVYPGDVLLDVDEILRGIRYKRNGNRCSIEGDNGSRAFLVVINNLLNVIFSHPE